MSKVLKVLIDADNLLYKAGCIRKVDAGGYSYAFHTLEESKKIIDEKAYEIRMAIRSKYAYCAPTQYFISPDNGSNFRNFGNKFQDYKGNRKKNNPKQPKPFYMAELRQYLIDEYGAIAAEGAEADDLVCTINESEDDCLVVSNDKDVLYGFAGDKLNIATLEFFTTTDDEAMFYFANQLVMGDTADNVKGVYGLGPAKSSKYISEYVKDHQDISYKEACIEAAMSLYALHYKGLGPTRIAELFDETARLLWLRRYDDDVWQNHFDMKLILKRLAESK